MKVILGADHRGFKLKEKIKEFLTREQIPFEDIGNHQLEPDDDFPVFAARVARTVASQTDTLGIVLCGSGVGVDIVANKISGIRSGFALSPTQVASARKDDNINVLAIAADQIKSEELPDFIHAFLHTRYELNDKHERRLQEIEHLEHE